MSVGEHPRAGVTRDLGLVIWQIRYEQRAYWRNRVRGVFTFVFPLMFLVIFASLDSGSRIASRGGISYDDFLVPGLLAYAVIGTTFVNLAIGTAVLRDAGVLKRMQGTPLPLWAYVTARIASSAIIMVLITIVVIVAGIVLWGLNLRAGAVPELLAGLLLGSAVFTTLGVGIVRFIRSAETAPVVINVIVLALTFISDIWFPTNSLPSAVRQIASAFPIKNLANALQWAFDPRHHGVSFDGSALRTLAIWTAIGVWMMLSFLRQPTGDFVPTGDNIA